MLPGQIAVLRELATRRHIDALMISIGANDLYFGRVIAACAPARHPTRLFLDCFNRAAPWDKEQKLSEAIQQAAANLRDRLDTIGREVATQNRWDYVDGIRKILSHHGYCAKADRWVVTWPRSAFAESGLTERISGTLHPNAKGHDEIAKLIVPKLEEALLSLPPPPSPSTGEVSAPVADGLAGIGLLGSAVLGWIGFRRTAPGRRARHARTTPPS